MLASPGGSSSHWLEEDEEDDPEYVPPSDPDGLSSPAPSGGMAAAGHGTRSRRRRRRRRHGDADGDEGNSDDKDDDDDDDDDGPSLAALHRDLTTCVAVPRAHICVPTPLTRREAAGGHSDVSMSRSLSTRAPY
jgi:hypothetical protein